MKEISPAVVLDTLFYAFSVWLLCFGILRYYRLGIALSALYACLCALATAAFCLLFLGGRYQRRVTGKRRQAARDALMLHLALEREETVLALLSDVLGGEGEVTRNGDSLIKDGMRYLAMFTMEPLSADAAARLIRCFGEEPFTVLCNALSPEAEKLLASFRKEALRADEVYVLFEKTEKIPETLICGDLPKKTVKSRLHHALQKRNARPFFVSGSLLLVMSLFALFPVYYLVSGAILLVCAILVRAFGYA